MKHYKANKAAIFNIQTVKFPEGSHYHDCLKNGHKIINWKKESKQINCLQKFPFWEKFGQLSKDDDIFCTVCLIKWSLNYKKILTMIWLDLFITPT